MIAVCHLRRLAAGALQLVQQRHTHSCRMLSSVCGGSNATHGRCAERAAWPQQPWRLGMSSTPSAGASGSGSGWSALQQRGSRRPRYASMDARVAKMVAASAAGKQFAGGRAVERLPGTEPPLPPPPPGPQQQTPQHQSSPGTGHPPASGGEAGPQPPDGAASRQSVQRMRRQQPRALRRSAQTPPPPADRNAAAAAAVAAADAALATSEPRAPGAALQSHGGNEQGLNSSGRNAFLAAGSSFRSLGIGESLAAALQAAGFPSPSHVQVSVQPAPGCQQRTC